MLETLQTCGRCKRDLPSGEFYERATSNWCRACYRAYYVERSGGMSERHCDWCDKQMKLTARRAAEGDWVFCSRQCKNDERNFGLRLGRLVEKETMAGRRCRHCGDPLSPSMRSDASYCSERCNQAAHKQTRKASARVGARQERIDRAYIIGRDGGRCHLCGKKPKGASLTIDHIVPLSDGGTHTAENLAVACLSCNCSKGARPANDQLRMVG